MKRKKKTNPADLCPICEQFMDAYCTGNKHTPFIDYKCYQKLCFGCFHVPKTEEQLLDKDGNIKECLELPYSHKYLHTGEELFKMGAVETEEAARRCVRSVKRAIKDAKLPRKPTPLKQPKDCGIIVNYDA